MGQYSPELIKRTLEVWQPRITEKLSEEDARQILDNALNFVHTLSRLKREQNEEQSEHGDEAQ